MSHEVELKSSGAVSYEGQTKGYGRLGEKFRQHALDFSHHFPIADGKSSCNFNVKRFDIWLAINGFVTLPKMDGFNFDLAKMAYTRITEETDAETIAQKCAWFDALVGGETPWHPAEGAKSDAWIAYTTRRYRLLNDLNKATAHLRVKDDHGVNPFHVSISHREVVVRHSQQKVVLGDLPFELESIVQTKKKKVLRLIKSSDFSVLSVEQQQHVESLLDAIEKMEDDVKSTSRFLTRQYNRLRVSFESAIKSGELIPKNGGLKGFIAYEEKEDGADYAILPNPGH